MNTLQQFLIALRSQWQTWFRSTPSPIAVPDPIPGREQLFAQLAALQERGATADNAHREAVAPIELELTQIQARAAGLQHRLSLMEGERQQRNFADAAATDRLRALIIEKAPISLGLFIEELDHELTRLRTLEPTIIPNGVDRDYVRMKKTVRYQSNAGSIGRRVKALQAARERAMAMQTEPLSVRDIAAECYRLRRDLPEIKAEETRGALAAIVLGH